MPSMHLAMAADVRPDVSHILSLTPEPGIESQIESIHARNPASIRCDVPPQDQANQRSILAGSHESETGTRLDQQGAGVVWHTPVHLAVTRVLTRGVQRAAIKHESFLALLLT